MNFNVGDLVRIKKSPHKDEIFKVIRTTSVLCFVDVPFAGEHGWPYFSESLELVFTI